MDVVLKLKPAGRVKVTVKPNAGESRRVKNGGIGEEHQGKKETSGPAGAFLGFENGFAGKRLNHGARRSVNSEGNFDRRFFRFRSFKEFTLCDSESIRH